MTRSISVARPRRGSSLPSAASLVEVAAELVEQHRPSCRRSAAAARLALLTPAGPDSMRMISLRIFSSRRRSRRGSGRRRPRSHGPGRELGCARGTSSVVAEESARQTSARPSSPEGGGICPEVTSSPDPTIRMTWARTSSTVISRPSSTRAARPSLLAERSPAGCARSRCSCASRVRASSWASTTTCLARSVNRWRTSGFPFLLTRPRRRENRAGGVRRALKSAGRRG